MSSPATPSAWSVTAQSPRTVATATGGVVDGYDVAFTTAEGHSGTVFVPAARYNPANVKAAVQAEADKLDAVGALTSDSEV